MITQQEYHKIIPRYSNFSPLYMNLTRFIFIYLMNMTIQAQILVYNNFYNDWTYQNDWIVENGNGVITNCGTPYIFGGQFHFGSGTKIFKNIELPPHATLSLSFNFWQIDSWGGEGMDVIVDDNIVYSTNYNSQSAPNICGLPEHGDGVNSVNIKITHFNQIAKIIIIGYQWYWGISEFEVSIIYQDCMDQNKDPFDGCFSGNYNCVQGCSDCIRGICIECQKGWEYDVLLQTCLPICGDQTIIYNEECDDGNQIQYDGCFKCKFSCPLFCKQCQFGKCLECLSNYNLIDRRCEETNGSQGEKSQDNFPIQISNLLDYGNYGRIKK